MQNKTDLKEIQIFQTMVPFVKKKVFNSECLANKGININDSLRAFFTQPFLVLLFISQCKWLLINDRITDKCFLRVNAGAYLKIIEKPLYLLVFYPFTQYVNHWHATEALTGICIVSCQRGGFSDEPPWLRAATRHVLTDHLKIWKYGPTLDLFY